MYYSKYVIVVLFLHHHEQGNIVHHYNKGMTGARMHGLISIVKAFARSTHSFDELKAAYRRLSTQ